MGVRDQTESLSGIKWNECPGWTGIRKYDASLSWGYKHINEYHKYVDHYLNIKFLLNRDLTGEDIIQIGFSSNFYWGTAKIIYDKFYMPSSFALRNIKNIKELCEPRFSEYKKGLKSNYLKYIYDKYTDRKLPFNELDRKYKNDDFSYDYSMFGGEYGKYRLNQEVTLESLFDDITFNKYAIYQNKYWRHINFTGCSEMIQLISELCTESENQLRLERGVPLLGEAWKSETQVYAFVKEIFSSYKVTRHYSPKWLSPMHLDMYIHELRFAIEFQGEQHFQPVDYFGGKEGFEKLKIRDVIKKKLCKKNKVELLYINYDDEDPQRTITNFTFIL